MERQRFDSRDHSRTDGGFSLLELTIASMMVLMLAWLVTTLSLDGMRAQKYTERTARVTEIAQDVLDEIQRGLGSAVGMFGAGAIGQGYVDALDMSSMPRPLLSSRIPTFDVSGRIERDPSNAIRTGNELFYARYAWTDEFQTSSGAIYRTDVYRFERFYLTPVRGGPAQSRPDGLNLCHWVSESLADGNQLDRISLASVRTESCAHLVNRTPDRTGVVRDAVKLLWIGAMAINAPGTLREIDVDGDLSLTPLPSRGGLTWRILPEIRLCDPDILIYRHHSVATNFAQTNTGVSRFSPQLTANEGFPHGFEIQVIGPPSARQVLVHLTLVSTNGDGRRAFADMQTVVDVRDP
ncbi:MAG: hypothetical protein HZB39_13870 [Planctomycetes bacterium]|nr:hypothetical protein [Planctomycetota bacterium]